MSGLTVHRESGVVSFARRVMPWMMQREAERNIMLGLFAVIQARPPETPPYLAWAERDGAITGVAMRTPPFRLLIAPGSEPEAVEAFARDLHATGHDLPGVMTGKTEAAAFAATWQALSGQSVVAGRHERLYRLETVIPARPVQGDLRPPAEAEIELLVDWWQAFAAEAIEPIPREQAVSAVNTRYGMDPFVAGLRVWAVNGQPVSMIGYTGPTPNSIRIGPVYTPPEQRGCGYASAATAALSQQLLDRGIAFVTLFTDLANPTSNRIYQDVGFRPVCDMDELYFAPVEVKTG